MILELSLGILKPAPESETGAMNSLDKIRLTVK
jgi:hypothetical protein